MAQTFFASWRHLIPFEKKTKKKTLINKLNEKLVYLIVFVTMCWVSLYFFLLSNYLGSNITRYTILASQHRWHSLTACYHAAAFAQSIQSRASNFQTGSTKGSSPKLLGPLIPLNPCNRYFQHPKWPIKGITMEIIPTQKYMVLRTTLVNKYFDLISHCMRNID